MLWKGHVKQTKGKELLKWLPVFGDPSISYFKLKDVLIIKNRFGIALSLLTKIFLSRLKFKMMTWNHETPRGKKET